MYLPNQPKKLSVIWKFVIDAINNNTVSFAATFYFYHYCQQLNKSPFAACLSLPIVRSVLVYKFYILKRYQHWCTFNASFLDFLNSMN